MKKILVIGALSVLIYLLYIILIIAPLMRIPGITEHAFLADIIASPAVLILFVLPYVVIYSTFRIKDYSSLSTPKNVMFHLVFYFVFHIGYVYLFENSFNIDSGKFMHEFIAILISMLIFFTYHVSIIRLLMKKTWFRKILQKNTS